MLVLNSTDNQQPHKSAANSGDTAAEQLTAVVEAIARNVDVMPAGNESDQASAPDLESAVAKNAGIQSAFPESSEDGMPKATPEASTVMLAQTDTEQGGNETAEILEPNHEFGMSDAEPQEGFTESPGDGIPESSSQADAVTAAQAEDAQTDQKPVEAMQPDYESGVANTGSQSGFTDPAGDGAPEAFSESVTVTVAQVNGTQAGHEPGMADADPQRSVQASAPDQNAHMDNNTHAETNDSGQEEIVQTHLFWSPFRSAWAAKGFARRLTNTTQIPIEVINAGPGNYRAAFNYRDETERLEHIERIEAITGLQLE